MHNKPAINRARNRADWLTRSNPAPWQAAAGKFDFDLVNRLMHPACDIGIDMHNKVELPQSGH